MQKAAEEVMAILDAEKKANEKPAAPNAGTNVTPPQSKIDDTRSVDEPSKVSVQTKDIQKAVKDGATIEEAVSEKLQEDEDKLPQAVTYGQHIFRDKSIQLFRTSEDAKPTKAYVLGPGHKSGYFDFGTYTRKFCFGDPKRWLYTTYRTSKVLSCGGTHGRSCRTIDGIETQKLLLFPKENFALTVATARTLNVNIVGEVFNNGTYNISAVNTAFNALIAAGGPNNIGSARNRITESR